MGRPADLDQREIREKSGFAKILQSVERRGAPVPDFVPERRKNLSVSRRWGLGGMVRIVQSLEFDQQMDVYHVEKLGLSLESKATRTLHFPT